MNLLIHPVYFGVLDYYLALSKASHVCFDINSHYQKQTYRNRTCIATANGALVLTVPVLHTGKNEHQTYKDTRISYAESWQKLHWKSIQIAYRTSPFFEFYEDDIAPIFEKKQLFLIDLNLQILEIVNNLVGMEFSVSKTQKYETSLSGYEDLRQLTVAKRTSNVVFPPYTQVLQKHHGFLPNLNILDLLFNEGPNSLDYLKNIS